jgi:hypothetical protein
MHLPTRYRMPILALTALVLALLVVGGILLVGGIGVPTATPTPSASTPVASATDPLATPEGAVRGFFEALGSARRTDDASVLEGLVTSKTSSAYLTAAGFLDGQRAAGKTSVLTANEITDLKVVVDGTQATVTFHHHQVGYDVDLISGQPRESPTALPDTNVKVALIQSGGRWLVDRFENIP